MTHAPVTFALALMLLAADAAPAVAQTRLYLLFAGARGEECTPADCEAPRVTPDGRYLAWTGTETLSPQSPAYLSVFDITRRVQGVPVTLAPRAVRASPVFTDTRTLRLFPQAERQPAVLVVEPAGVRSYAAPCAIPDLSGVSGNGERLFVSCINPEPVPPTTAVIDSESGASVGVVPPAYYWPHASNDDGTDYFDVQHEPLQAPVYRRYDVASGAVLASYTGAAGKLPAGAMVFDQRASRLYVALGSGVRVLDAATLQPVGFINAPATLQPGGIVVDPERPVAYVVWWKAEPNRYRTYLSEIDATTFTPIVSADLPGRSRFVAMVQGPRPPRVAALSSSVAGRSASLEWSLPAGRSLATHVIVEAGSTPGSANLARFQLPPEASTLMVPDVPRGTYYVRVRAANGAGPGESSNEITVTVP